MVIEQHTPFATPIFTIQYGGTKIIKSHQELKNKALSLAKENNGRVVSNINGFQSNEFKMNDPLVNKFYFEILPVIQQYVTLFQISCNYDTNLNNLWYNVNGKYSYNHNHSHAGCAISGVYYLNTPENCGDICFDNPDRTMQAIPFYNGPFKQYNEFNSDFFGITPKEGLMILFPSHIFHRVDMNNSDENRISVAFNIEVKKG